MADRAKGVEPLGDSPREAFFLGFILQVAGREVNGEGIDCALLSTYTQENADFEFHQQLPE